MCRCPTTDADRYVAEQVAAARLVGVPLWMVPRRWPSSTPTSRRSARRWRLTPAAIQGVRDLFLPPMKGWVQVLTPARPAWGTLVSLGFATLPAWARQMFSMPGFSLTDAAATAALRAFRTALLALPGAGALVADRAGGAFARRGADRPPDLGSGVVLGEEAPGLPRGDGGLAGRAAGPEVAPAALHARDGREGDVGVLPRRHRLGGRGDVDGDVLGPAHVVGQRPLGVLEGGHRAAGQVVQLDAAARLAQRAAYART